MVCLIGSSGSGKSTLLRCLDLLEDIDDGVIEFEGREISDPRVDRREVRQRIGMVFQAYNLFPHLTVLDNCTLAPRRVHGVARAEAERQAHELLERFGLADQADKHPDRLSGGQQQRVALVRALRTSPALLLLDEITAALDPELVGEVLDDRPRPRRPRARRWCSPPTRWPSPARSRPGSASSTAAGSSSRARPSRSSATPARTAPASSCAACSPTG